MCCDDFIWEDLRVYTYVYINNNTGLWFDAGREFCTNMFSVKRHDTDRWTTDTSTSVSFPLNAANFYLQNNYYSLKPAVRFLDSPSPSSSFPSFPFPDVLQRSQHLSFCQPSVSLSIHRSLPEHRMLACQFLHLSSSLSDLYFFKRF